MELPKLEIVNDKLGFVIVLLSKCRVRESEARPRYSVIDPVDGGGVRFIGGVHKALTRSILMNLFGIRIDAGKNQGSSLGNKMGEAGSRISSQDEEEGEEEEDMAGCRRWPHQPLMSGATSSLVMPASELASRLLLLPASSSRCIQLMLLQPATSDVQASSGSRRSISSHADQVVVMMMMMLMSHIRNPRHHRLFHTVSG